MRYTTLLSLFIVVSLGVSCGADDDEINLVGTYTLEELITRDCLDESLNGTETLQCTAQNCIAYAFGADGSIVITEVQGGRSTTLEGTYTLDGNDLDMMIEGDLIIGEVRLKGKRLTILVFDNLSGCFQEQIMSK